MKRFLKVTAFSTIIIFALIGLLFTTVFVGMQYGLLNVRGTIAERNAFFGTVPTSTSQTADSESVGNGCLPPLSQTEPCPWQKTTQWAVVKGGLLKDAVIINRVSKETGVPARMIAAAVVPEQVRFFVDNREVFKRYFEPLKILASLSQFSLGVSGIKQETAEAIETNANDPASAFYPGPEMAPLLAYSATTTNQAAELFTRLTDEKDHYYAYLYTAVYLKEVMTQWENAGYDVSQRPDVLVTLFNLGFKASEPKADPVASGAPIMIGGNQYSFGSFGTFFYHSDELTDIFPR